MGNYHSNQKNKIKSLEPKLKIVKNPNDVRVRFNAASNKEIQRINVIISNFNGDITNTGFDNKYYYVTVHFYNLRNKKSFLRSIKRTEDIVLI